MYIHYVESHNKILILCIIKIPSKYLLVKLHATIFISLSTVRIIQDSDDIVWWLNYSCLYDSVIRGNFRWELISVSGNFNLYFQTMAPEKACVAGYGAGNIPAWKFPHHKRTCALPWTTGLWWECMAPWVWGLGVGPFCNLHNVPYLEW